MNHAAFWVYPRRCPRPTAVKKTDRYRMQRPVFSRCAALVIMLAAVAGCSSVEPSRTERPASARPYKVYGKWYQPRSHAHGFRQKGIASWYGKKFHGRKTSNGETYDMYGIPAAHKTLPFNTVVRVHNLDNGKKIDVRINDRGPFIRGRIIDLSYGAARKAGLVGPGTARVEIVALGAVSGPKELKKEKRTYVPVDFEKGEFTFQVGAFRNRNNAEKLRAKLDRNYQNAHITTYDSPDGVFYRVRVGRFTSLDQARRGEEILIREGFDPFIVAE